MNIQSMFSLAGKTAMISGASSGLGEFFSRVLAEAGAEVILTARREDKLQAVVADIRAAGGKAHAISMDVTSKASVELAFSRVDTLVGKLDILVNNAGISSTPAKFVSQAEEDWSFLFETNIKGAWRVAQQAAQRMVVARSGAIVNTGSIYSLVTGIMKADYNVSKAALLQLTKNMALELSRSGVRVNALCPGYFSTAINADEFASERGKAYVAKLVPQRLGEYRELAGPLLLLVSDAGSYISGTSLVVDGGTSVSPI